MSYLVGDFLDQLDAELVAQRRLAALHVDRADALRALRSHAFQVAAALKRPITVEDVFECATDEQERAERRALADRITREAGGEPALGIDETRGHHSESGASL